MEISIRPLAIEDYDALVTLWQRAGLKFRPQGRDSREALGRQLSQGGDYLGGSLGEGGGWRNLLMSFNTIFLIAAFIAFECVLEERGCPAG